MAKKLASPPMLFVAIVFGTVAHVVKSESIATGNGRGDIFRPARRSIGEAAGEDQTTEDGDVEQQLEALKRSMSLGRLSFRPGKRWVYPVPAAYAIDRQNGHFDFLLMGDDRTGSSASASAAGGGEASGGGKQQKAHSQMRPSQSNAVNHIRFRLLSAPRNDEEFGPFGGGGNYARLQEAAMGKRTVASGRFGFRPAKRSMAVGRTGFRPGKRSLAMGRLFFRPGKRVPAASAEAEYNSEYDGEEV